MLPQLVAISASAESYTVAIAHSRFAFVCMEGESVAALRAAGQSKLRASGYRVLPQSIPPPLVPSNLRHPFRIARSEHSRLYGIAM